MPQSSPVASQRLLTRYRDRRHRLREVITVGGASATLLLVDRDAFSGGDCRLLAHLEADEPWRNAALVLADYFRRLEREPLACRRLRPEDLKHEPADTPLEQEGPPVGAACRDALSEVRFELHPQATGREHAQLRWWSCDAHGPLRPVSLRDAVATLESYEPIRTLTFAAVNQDGGCTARKHGAVSVTVLRAELKRVLASPIVLNRALREAVLERVERGDVSLSEVAIRCGRVKHDSNGNASGETSWLGRRLGILPEGGKSSPTPWIHSDVLALIARSGIGIPPREVEL